MAQLVITPVATADLMEIYAYLLAEAGMSTAEKYRQEFDALYEHLVSYPESCPLRPGVARQTRMGVVSPYILLYRYLRADDIVLVQRVVHGARRITGKMLRERKS